LTAPLESSSKQQQHKMSLQDMAQVLHSHDASSGGHLAELVGLAQEFAGCQQLASATASSAPNLSDLLLCCVAFASAGWCQNGHLSHDACLFGIHNLSPPQNDSRR